MRGRRDHVVFFLLFALINKRPPKGTEQKLLEHWEAANRIASEKLLAMDRIVEALEMANKIKLGK